MYTGSPDLKGQAVICASGLLVMGLSFLPSASVKLAAVLNMAGVGRDAHVRYT